MKVRYQEEEEEEEEERMAHTSICQKGRLENGITDLILKHGLMSYSDARKDLQWVLDP